MALALVIIGIVIIASAVKGTEHGLAALLESDLFGNDGFIIWVAAIGIVGLLGKIPGFAGPSKALLVLIFTVLLLGNSQFFDNLAKAIAQASATGPIPNQPIQTPSQSSSTSTSASSSSSSSSTSSDLADAETAAEVAALFA